MPASDEPSQRRGRRWPRLAALLVLGVALLLAGGYAAFPWLMATLAPRLAAGLGIDGLRLAVSRPGAQMLAVPALEVVSGRLRISVRGGTLRYTPTELLSGQLQSVHLEELTVRVTRQGGAGGAAAEPPTVEGLFAAVPAERVTVDRLTVEVPSLSFRAAGDARLARRRLELHLQGLSPPEAERFAADASVDAGGEIRILVGERAPAESGTGAAHRVGPAPLLAVTSTLGSRELALQGELTLQGFALDLTAALMGAPAGQGRLQGQFQASLPWPWPEHGALSQVAADGSLSGRWAPPAGPWSVESVAARWRLRQGKLRSEAAGDLRFPDQRLQVTASAAPFDLAQRGGVGRLAVRRSDAQQPALDLRWTLEPAALALEGSYALNPALLRWLVGQAGLPAGEGRLRGELATRLPWPLPSEWRGLRPPSRGSLEGSWQPDEDVPGIANLAGTWALSAEGLAGRLQGAIRYHGLTLPASLQLDRLQLDGDAVSARATAALGETVRLPLVLHHRLDRQTGTLALDGDIRVDAPLAAGLMSGWSEPYDLTAGAVGVEGELAWGHGEGFGGEVGVHLQDVAARYQDYRVAGVTARLTFAGTPAGAWSLEPSPWRAALLDTGVELHELETGLAWSGDTLTVQPTTARLLGGTARVDTFAYRTDTGRGDFVVDLANLELAQILALEGEHVAGTGILDGSLPVQIRDHAPAVVAGQMRSHPPGGVLRVSQALAGGTGQPGLDFALRALQDFRYSVLQADVAYSPAGDLTLAVHLEGRNPAIEGGRPIHYNVTVNENLPTLLKSLRLQDEITRQIERRVTD